MRVVLTEDHTVHAPSGFIARGNRIDNPEIPRRAEILEAAAKAGGHTLLAAEPVDIEVVRAVHADDYLAFLANAWEEWTQLPDHGAEIIPNVHSNRNMGIHPTHIVGKSGHYQADTACPIGPGTWAGALASAGVAQTAADLVRADMATGEAAPHAYALCRPPGHHAYADQAGGFCFLNNSAIAAQRLRDTGLDRIAILDVDVHHGNGTQGIFYRRDDVLTVSIHGDPAAFYPFFTGYADEIGAGPGRGANLNLPLPRGTGDGDFLETLDHALERIAAWGPDALVIALGLDASEKDPLAFLAVTTAGFEAIGRRLGATDLPTLLVQEGGYISDILGDNLAATLKGFESART